MPSVLVAAIVLATPLELADATATNVPFPYVTLFQYADVGNVR